MTDADLKNNAKPQDEAPIVLIVFNRPRETSTLLEEIRKLEPKKLFIIADGPRLNRPGEAELCLEVRRIATNIDWECEVKTDFSDVNLGCKNRVVTGLDWVFTNTDKAIILEDDCIPARSFFTFANEMLNRYANNEEIGIVSGTSLLPSSDSNPADFYLSQYPQVWGWATWKRAWNMYDPAISAWKFDKKTDFIRNRTSNWKSARRWKRGFDSVYKGTLDTWDYQLVYMTWKFNLKTIVPYKNLVSNIGFGSDATHT